MHQIEQALLSYRSALDQLEERSDEAGPLRVARVLLARSVLAQLLTGSANLSPALLLAIAEQDARLRARAAAINALADTSALATWRQTLNAPGAGWWSLLDNTPAANTSQPGIIWTILAGFFLTAGLSLLAEIARRFLAGGPDLLGAFSTLSQALLALLAGSTFLAFGRGQVERALAHFGVHRRFQPPVRAGLALAVLLVILGVYTALPDFAAYYHSTGYQQQKAGAVTGAIASYQRALSLDPDYASAHYDLAVAYEDVLEYDKAMSEYQRAIELNGNHYPAYNDLARLYLLKRGDAATALELLDKAFGHDPPEAQQVPLLKNRAWAEFNLKLYSFAEADLQEALRLNPAYAPAYCLLAQVREAEGHNDQFSWEQCLSQEYTDPSAKPEAVWLTLARERLEQHPDK